MPKAELIFPPHLIDEARRAHLRGATQYETGKILGCSQQTMGRRIRDWGWGPSRLRGRRETKPLRFAPMILPAEDAEEGTDNNDLCARLKLLVGREMKRAEICGGPPLEVARTLASLAQTLKLLHTLPAEMSDVDSLTEQHVADLTRNIAARLNALVAEDDEREIAARRTGTDEEGD
jgi:hypothetical protein